MKKGTKKLFLKAVQKRLDEVSRFLKNFQGEVSSGDVTGRGLESEEALRLIMVRYLPKLHKGAIGEGDKKDLFYLLDLIKSNAAGRDLRYFDAFNNIFEAASVRKWDEKDLKQYIIPFYRKYETILKGYLDSN